MSGVRLEIERVVNQQLPRTSLGRKEHYSKFHVMWSSNVRPVTSQEGMELVEEMDHVFNQVMNERPADFFKFSSLGKKGTFKVDPEVWNSQNIRRYKIRFVIEKGSHPKGGRIHLHALVFVVHYTYLQIESSVLKELLCKRLEDQNSLVKGCYLKIQWVPATEALENYIGKSPFSGTGLTPEDNDDAISGRPDPNIPYAFSVAQC